MAPLSNSELNRYSRHLLLPDLGKTGQEKLKNSRVLVVGAGGLGSPVILYLAAAGVGNIGIIDFDKVDRSNLQRQVIYCDVDVDKSKALCAALRALALNPEISVDSYEFRLDASNALELFSKYDLIVDGSDNFGTRYLVNDACVLQKKSYVYGSIFRFEGQVSVFCHDNGPCYRCLFPDPPEPSAVPNCAEAGVLGVMAGVIGCMQANEAIKIILGIGESLSGYLLLYDSLDARIDKLQIPRDPACKVCGKNPTITNLNETVLNCHKETQETMSKNVSAVELQLEIQSGRKLQLLDVRNYEEVALCRIADAKHIPLSELSQRCGELDADIELVVYCKSGVRSQRALQVLAEKGFSKARNLAGGIIAWSKDVDPSLALY